jgi:hypothetical protein
MPISDPVVGGVSRRVVKDGDAFRLMYNHHGILLLYNLRSHREMMSSGWGSFYHDFYFNRCSVSV